MKQKKITIVGTSVYGIENAGDEVLLSVLVRELRALEPTCHITWVARHKNEKLAKEYQCDQVVVGLEHDTKAASEGRWFNGLNKGDSVEHLHALDAIIRDSDLLIIGGDPFQEITLSFQRGLASYAAVLITHAKFVGTPVMLYSIHMGSKLVTPYAKEITRYCIENANLTTLREAFSLTRLHELAIRTDNCVVVSDTAWAINPVSYEHLSPAAKKFFKDAAGKRVVGFNIRHHYWQWSEQEWHEIAGEIAAFCDHIVEKHDAIILSIPNCTYDTDHKMEDDRPVARDVQKRMKHKTAFHCLEDRMELNPTLAIFPKLWAHVSNRRHSAVFAAVHHVPVLPLGGSWHVRPAFDEIGLGRYDIEPEFWSAESLSENFDEVVARREEIIETIAQQLPRLRENAIRQAQLALKVCGA
ncbi:hypothetical protein COU19_00385 [Candidatus Kaiserbacteria bacterium CG10_big_fil_rev_8_21_14_0_10_56_12]|uniref:Polysaccharide pyruvyl transferase domain-containing protein n=1 Tax=Candidatus Kaiserbacteria bacterium CG10_big_fil_rev_8_21_14_0_10_56_12 TaxID=1974611 RepID=A0A2H0UAF8_9BACT|nr:MAG: hypothetical protein COU19_00385 [Candidatus Kaiserbacteria bacterium CG10_big_fil_rev_8_21_14_0_10_56_12]